MDIGGTLTKLVYLEPKKAESEYESEEINVLKNITKGLTVATEKRKSGTIDSHLAMNSVVIGDVIGSLHFTRFPTSEMDAFFTLAKRLGMSNLISTVGATGGGSFKFEKQFSSELDVKMVKFDELDSLLKGMMTIVKMRNPGEIYYWEKKQKIPYNFNDPYPFILVNIGSGVSFLAVYGPYNFKRISGSSLGGGTFLGLCCLLTGCTTFEEAIELAVKGDNTKVDKLVRDIYGGDYGRFGLSGNLVASSFANMIHKEKRETAHKADLARSTLVSITTNIGSIARMWAVNLNINRVLFVGNFLRANPISARLLAYAMTYWSKGDLQALFLEHEGYFGAVGCLMAFNEFRLPKKL